MSASMRLSWRDGVSAGPAEGGGMHVEGAGTRLILRPVPAVADALFQLAPPGEDEDRLADLVLAAGPKALAGWYYALQVLAGRGLLCRSVWASGHRLAYAGVRLAFVRDGRGGRFAREASPPLPVRIPAARGRCAGPGNTDGPGPCRARTIPAWPPWSRPWPAPRPNRTWSLA